MNDKTLRDMTQGSPMKLILGFAVPMLFGLLFQQLYSMIDTIIVGKYLGVDALAAVGSTGSINFMIIGFCIGVCSGFSIPVAQKFGEKNEKALRRFMANGGWLAAGFSVMITAVVCLLCRNILEWMDTPGNIIDDAYRFIFIIFLGIPATFLYNFLSGIIRSLGDSKTPLFFLLISSGLNVVLDLFTILVLHMGVSGAAWSTVISQGVSGALCFVYMKRKYTILKMEGDEWKPDRRTMEVLCGMGIPMGLQYSITAIGSVILQSAVNGLGSVAVASVTAGSKISMFFACPFDAMGATMATYGGQNVGAKKLDRIYQGVKACSLLGFCYAVVAFVVLSLFGSQVALLFVDQNQLEILHNTQLFLVGNSMFYFPLALVNIFRFMIQGLGFSRLAMLAGVCEMTARTIAGFFLVPLLGYIAVCYASPIAWVAADLFLVPAFLLVTKQLARLFGLDRQAVAAQACRPVGVSQGEGE